MRLWLVRNSQLLRRHANAPFAKHSLAQVASHSNANRRLFSLFNAAWLPPGIQQKRTSPGANGIGQMGAAGGHLLQKSSYNPLPMLQFVRHCRSRYRGWRPKVEVSSEIWQLLNEYDVPAIIKRVYNVHVETAQTTSRQVQLSLHGGNATLVAEMLGTCLRGIHRADPPRKFDVHERFDSWLLAEGRNGLRVKDIRVRSGALVRLSQNRKSVLLVGPSEATLAAKRMIDALHFKRRQIPKITALWPKLPGKGANCARIMDLERKFDTRIDPGPYNDGSDSAHLLDLTVVGEREEKVDDVLAVIDGIHVKRSRILPAVRSWLAHTSNGAECARSIELSRKFDTFIHLGPLTEKDGPDRLVDLTVVGERKDNVDDALAIIDGLHAKRRQIPQINALWLKLTGKGANCARIMDLERKFDTRIVMGPYNDKDDTDCMADLAVVGEREENVDEVLAVIDGLHVKRRQIPRVVRSWLARGAERARSIELSRKFDTCIHSGPLNDKDDPDCMFDLAVVGEREENVDDVLAKIDGLYVKRCQIPQSKSLWLKNPGKGAERSRLGDLERKFETRIDPGPYNDGSDSAHLLDLTVVGEREEGVDAVLDIIDGIHVKRRRIQRAVRSWLANTAKGAERARSIELSRKFDTFIHSGPLTEKDDPDCMFDLAVVGEREEDVDGVLDIIDGLHIRHGQISRAVCRWLSNTRNGAKQDRRVDLDREFDTRVYIQPLNDDIDPTRMEKFAVVGECEENVDEVLAAIESIVVEKVNVAKGQAELWTGDEDDQNRPFHVLEDTTDTHIDWDEAAYCLHVSGRPEGVNKALELIRERLDTPPWSGS